MEKFLIFVLLTSAVMAADLRRHKRWSAQDELARLETGNVYVGIVQLVGFFNSMQQELCHKAGTRLLGKVDILPDYTKSSVSKACSIECRVIVDSLGIATEFLSMLLFNGLCSCGCDSFVELMGK